MDPVTIGLLIGLATLVIERIYAWAKKIKKSECCGTKIEIRDSHEYCKI